LQTRLIAVALAATAVVVAAVQPWSAAPAEAAVLAGAGAGIAAHRRPSLEAAVADLDSASDAQCDEDKAPSDDPIPAAPAAAELENADPSLASDGETSGGEPEVAGEDADWKSGFALASKRTPRDGGDWFDRGMKLHGDEDWAEAAQAFVKAFEQGHREGVSAYNAACAYARNGEPDRAFEWLDRAMAAGFDLHGYLGRDEDLESLESDPRFADLRKKARERTRHKKRYEIEAKAEKLERLMSQPVGDGDALYHLGSELLKLGDYERSARAFQRSAQGTEHPADSLYNLACALSLKEDRAAALQNLEKAILAGFSRSAKGIREDEDLDNLHSEPRFKEILRLADQLHLGLDDDDWEGRIGGKLLRSVERNAWRKKAEDYEAFAMSHPQIGRAWFNLGFAGIKGELPAEAASAFRKALDLKYRPPTTMYNLACSFALLDQKDVAFSWLFKAIEAGVDDNGSLIRWDDDLDNLRGDPRYRQALRMARKQETEKEE
jgi:Flp pilus assembly protein TadD